MLKKLRVALALIFFVPIVLLFLDFTGLLRGVFGWTATVQLLPAALASHFVILGVWIVVTLLVGRIYCSTVCPLGVMQDAIYAISRRRKRYRNKYSRPLQWLRVAFLIVFIVLMACGMASVAALIAPYSTFGRIVTSLFQPLYIAANNLLADGAKAVGSYAFYPADLWMRSAVALAVAAITFIVIAVLAWRGGRTWCNTVCPVGTVLGFLSRFALLKPRIDAQRCVSCGQCSRQCKASCIDHKAKTIDYTRCVDCMNCLTVCRKGALRFSMKGESIKSNNSNKSIESNQSNETKETNQSEKAASAVDTGRRHFLLTAALATTAATVAEAQKKVDGGYAPIQKREEPKRRTKITPPGSQSMRNLSQRCTACLLCVSECPNGVLRPSKEWDSLLRPTMSYERGFCRPECTRCADVCPTGAIRPITAEQKTAIQIGHAVWNPHLCLTATKHQRCGNCARHCPAGAITMVPMNPDDPTSSYIPSIDETRCIGCGGCENHCPVRPLPAIYVEGHEVHREI